MIGFFVLHAFTWWCCSAGYLSTCAPQFGFDFNHQRPRRGQSRRRTLTSHSGWADEIESKTIDRVPLRWRTSASSISIHRFGVRSVAQERKLGLRCFNYCNSNMYRTQHRKRRSDDPLH
uniref:Putative secreted protein n=1 Tax=Anopheles marajoara TaxID=58244 RepID=A0A2M4C7N7_9DIPT